MGLWVMQESFTYSSTDNYTAPLETTNFTLGGQCITSSIVGIYNKLPILLYENSPWHSMTLFIHPVRPTKQLHCESLHVSNNPACWGRCMFYKPMESERNVDLYRGKRGRGITSFPEGWGMLFSTICLLFIGYQFKYRFWRWERIQNFVSYIYIVLCRRWVLCLLSNVGFGFEILLN